ncbi:glycosyl transferase family protein [Chitinilyticum piscinae]|uniref:Glycosyl transferase family protein n=1 Tax=Chitinilyticum piscinae TaxID=2866724 RepID=A0A8J7FHF6_9NEIS|nr:glycosyl transferase family protein [Chitinilyticum piscinae]MBE9608265.1 glycosyl transferase family protein [Chitinilyticum piscinae]
MSLSLGTSVYFAQYYAALEVVAVVLTILILISSVDDVFIDIWYWARELWRKLTIKRRADYRPLSAAQLKEKNEQYLAIMVPAWQEYDVIAQMVENMMSVLDYRRYVVFVGTYCNDQATIDEVERVRRHFRHLLRVEVPNPGPTCKADCLNWIIQAIFKYEQDNGIEFAGIVMHDAEDVLHPLELKFFNYLLPRKDMIQLPVTSLERDWFELVAGTYMDEFAEWHGKDLVVRESLSGMVPSAGVGTCFSRRALLHLCADSNNQPFNTDSLTEDYDIGTRLAATDMKTIFARFPVQFQVRRKSWFGLAADRETVIDMPLCVREYFPDTLYTSYRQRARWVLGISLQGWMHLGWHGSLADRYLLFRDRKGIVTSLLNVLAYLVFFQFLAFYIASKAGWWTLHFPPIFAPGSWPLYIATFTGSIMISRVVQRFYFVNRLYGWEQGLMSIPRMAVSNLINFLATMRAWRMFLNFLFTGKRLVWDKTMHHFPSAERLAKQRKRLGELLVSWQAIEPEQLETALRQQSQFQLPVGRLLVVQGALDDETLAEAISAQYDLRRARLDKDGILQLHRRLAFEHCFRLRAIPFLQHEQLIHVAVATPLTDTDKDALEQQLGKPIRQFIARESEINAALRLLSGLSSDFLPDGKPALIDLMVIHNLLTARELDEAIRGFDLDEHQHLINYLISKGAISREDFEQLQKLQQAQEIPSARSGQDAPQT